MIMIFNDGESFVQVNLFSAVTFYWILTYNNIKYNIMNGKNWNSKSKTWSSIKSVEIQERANLAQMLKNDGKSVKEIADIMNLSVGRIYEYLK